MSKRPHSQPDKSRSLPDNSISNGRVHRAVAGRIVGRRNPPRRPYGAPKADPAAPPVRVDRRLRLQDLADEWLLNLRVEGRSPRTLKWYRHHIDAYLAAGGVEDLSSLTATELRRYICALQDRGLSENSVRGAFLSLRCMCNWAAREGYPVDAALLRVKTPRVAEQELTTYTREQQDAILAAAPTGWPRLTARILLGTGIRISELCDMRIDDFEDGGEQAFLKVQRGKGGKFRRVPVSYRLRRDIIRFATAYLQNGGELERLRKILGHTSYQMVMRYVHLDKGDLAEDIDDRTPY